MVNTDAVAVTFTATNGTIDKLLLSTYVHGKEDQKFLTKYKAQLASARSKLSDDLYFLSLVAKYVLVKAAKK